ncbi:TPA: teichoic acid D-Ala incorporation-associated protein DltX [Streptococcus suis]|nr:teichoic acid D-Ala incorporation-associated protein DltX [Streptococcus suis]MCL4897410.1 teichoic acid D-Ala incorporation-associated protein DltX [Streptococcus suis]HEM3547943.1 teichoic acid D-Ala incorporation-associated protein DltX [Streptococcus suis]HEM3559216.1 teichoic acid D-Ala incorporation-associated protein DltX [Streptococcus suis]
MQHTVVRFICRTLFYFFILLLLLYLYSYLGIGQGGFIYNEF